jgi:cell wall-associated NlpC family hydrolase
MGYRGRHLKLRRSRRWPWLLVPVLALGVARSNTDQFPAVTAEEAISGQFTAVTADVIHERPARRALLTTTTTRPVRRIQPEPVRRINPPKPAPTTSRAPASVSTSKTARVLAAAKAMLGIPYVYGGNSLSGMDCSAFTQRAYATVGVRLPRFSGDQHRYGRQVSQPQPGDLVWWGPEIHHVAIYYGHGLIIGAHRPGVASNISPLWGSPRFYRMY